MKQHITGEQLNELSEKGINRLKECIQTTRHMGMPFLSIGHMIEFLDRGNKSQDEIENEDLYREDWHYVRVDCIDAAWEGELVDVLWEEVKGVLEQ